MKTIEDVIDIDTKWLIHFLKENHIFKQYFEKLFKQSEHIIKHPNYNNWLNYIKSNKEFYKFSSLEEEDIKLDEMLVKNYQLFNSIFLFANWLGQPLVLKYNASLEAYDWNRFSDKFLNLKRLLNDINAVLI